MGLELRLLAPLGFLLNKVFIAGGDLLKNGRAWGVGDGREKWEALSRLGEMLFKFGCGDNRLFLDWLLRLQRHFD
jgi:hypothetical protein